jgi:hypothetical protein
MRHTTLSRDPAQLAEQCAENARDGNRALEQRARSYTKTVQGYSATGSTSTVIQLVAQSSPPVAITLVKAQKTRDPAAAVAAVGIPNVTYANGIAGTYEPSGLTTDEQYDLTFLVLE